jgi:hypothetical protein
MPFQSEKQRRYLWANEPEIARDWTDTYGSRVKKFDGGEIYKGIEALENPMNYLRLSNPAIPESGYTDYGELYDPAFGRLENFDAWNTGYPEHPRGNLRRYRNYGEYDYIPSIERYQDPERFALSEEEPSGINQLPNDFNRNYQPEDANWRTRLRNKGSGIKRALASGLGRIVDFPLGIMSTIAQGFPNNAQEQAMVDLYGGNTVTSGPMAGYNAASMFGKGLPAATQKRIRKREETLQKMADWEGWRKKRFQQKTAILKAELAKQQRALLDQANQVKTTYHRDEPARQGGQNPSAQSFRSAPGGLSQAQSRAARGDPQGTGGGWKW